MVCYNTVNWKIILFGTLLLLHTQAITLGYFASKSTANAPMAISVAVSEGYL